MGWRRGGISGGLRYFLLECGVIIRISQTKTKNRFTTRSQTLSTYSSAWHFSTKLILSADMPAAGISLNFSTPLHFTDPPKATSASGEIDNEISFQKTEFFLFLLGVLMIAALMAYFCCRSSRTKDSDMPVVHIENWLRAFNLVWTVKVHSLLQFVLNNSFLKEFIQNSGNFFYISFLYTH